MDTDEIIHRFTYHPPTGTQPKKYEEIREHALNFALFINVVCPDCREKSLAMTKIEEAVMHANAGIARSAAK